MQIINSKNKVSGVKGQRSRRGLWGILLLLLLPMMACGVVNSISQTNNQVRLAVYQYERETRGPAHDLVIDFQRNEPRIKFEDQNENGGRTVWLPRLGAREFFSLRPPENSYLYLQNIDYNDDQSQTTVTVYRGSGSGYQGRHLILENEDGQWLVSQDTVLENTTPEEQTGE